MLRAIVIFYFLLGAFGLGLIVLRVDADSAFNPFGHGGNQWPYFTAVAIVAIAGVHFGSVFAMRASRSLSRAVGEMTRILGGLSRTEIFVVALASGLAEELFFRGWLVNEIGLVFSSLIFGLVHVPPTRNWIYWPVFAFLVGLFLGALCLWSNSLVYAVFVHAGINYINILRLPRERDGLEEDAIERG